MSSPTINPVQGSGYPSLATIMNLVRSLVNDTQPGLTDTPGEGQIITDNNTVSPFTQPFLNSAIREVYRELRNVGQPTLIKDNVIITGVPPMNSPVNGLAGPDPAVQVYLGFEGFFDGLLINDNVMLPPDVLYPERVWERQTGTNNPFIPMTQPDFGLPSVLQGPKLKVWEWRGDKIWMVGSTQTNDMRLRYWAQFPQFFSPDLDFSSTFVPILDSADAVAYKTAAKYSFMLGSTDAPGLKTESIEQMRQLKLANVRRMQSQNYQRIPYGGDGGHNATGGFVVGWQ